MTTEFPPIAKLHTDSLEEKYGPVSAVVHEHTASRRIIDIVDANGISRTHAITWFPEVRSDEKISYIRGEIAAGSLIGKTFKKYGFSIEKKPLVKGAVNMPEWLQKRFKVDNKFAEVLIYEFWAVNGADRDLYGLVAEIYSPDFISALENTKVDEVGKSEFFKLDKVIRDLFWYLYSPTPFEN